MLSTFVCHLQANLDLTVGIGVHGECDTSKEAQKLVYIAGIGDAVFDAFKTEPDEKDEGPKELLKSVAGDMKDIGDAVTEDFKDSKITFDTGASVTFKARLNLAIPVTPTPGASTRGTHPRPSVSACVCPSRAVGPWRSVSDPRL